MAVLEKIRRQSVILFIVIIGALLAFILGDFISSRRPSDVLTKVGNIEVKYDEYQTSSDIVRNQIENQISQYVNKGYPVPAELLDEDANFAQGINNLLYEKLLAEECENMGIKVSDEFLSAFVQSPSAQNYVYEKLYGSQETYVYFAQKGITDVAAYRDAIKNPARYNLGEEEAAMLTQAWASMESDADKQLRLSLYANAVTPLFQPNKADAMVDFENKNKRTSVKYLTVPYSTVNDKDVELTDADYQAVYDKVKGGYAIKDETREVAYIVVPIKASEQDYADANQLMTDFVAAISTPAADDEDPATEPRFKTISSQKDQLAQAQLSQILGDSVTPATGVVKRLSDYNALRINGSHTGIANVNIDFMEVESKAFADSIFDGKTTQQVDSIIRIRTNGQNVDLRSSLVKPNDVYKNLISALPSFKENVENAQIDKVTIVNDTVQGTPVTYALLVKERSEPELFYDVTQYTRKVYPSTVTEQQLTQKLHSYVANNGTAESFAEGTEYPVHFALVDNKSYSVDNSNATPGTRSIVKWIMTEAENGQVSPVFTKKRTNFNFGTGEKEMESYIIAVAVIDTYNGDFIPATSHYVKDQLKNQALREKKAETLAKKYNGTSFDDYAAKMGATPMQQTVTFGANTFGLQAQGAVAAAKKGDLIAPVKGNTGIYVFQITDVAQDSKFEDKKLSERLSETTTLMPVNFESLDLFVGKRKISNYTLDKFTQSEIKE